MKKTLCVVVALLGINAMVAQTTQITRFEGVSITGVRASSLFKVELIRSDQTRAEVALPTKFLEDLIFTISPEGVVEIGLKTEKNGMSFIDFLKYGFNSERKIDGMGRTARIYLRDLTRIAAAAVR